VRLLSFGAGSGCFIGSLPIASQPVMGGNAPLKKKLLLSERVPLEREDTEYEIK
jgi:hypothetical protein